jgi:ParB family chromosome partitioning protein
MSSSKFSRNIKGHITSMANWSGGHPEEDNEEPHAFGEKLRQEMEAATATVPIQEVELDLLLDNPYQYLARRNMDETSMQELVDSIKNNGFYGALLARRKTGQAGRLEVAYGHRRKEAARRVGLKTVPVKIVELNDTEMARIMASENFSRLDLDPIGEANVVGFLADQQNLSAREISEIVGKKRGWVESRLTLYNAPVTLKQMVEDKPATFSHVPLLLRLRKDERQLKQLVEQVLDEELTLEELRSRVEKKLKPEPEPGTSHPDDLLSATTPDSIVKNATNSMLHGNSYQNHNQAGEKGDAKEKLKASPAGLTGLKAGLGLTNDKTAGDDLEQQITRLEVLVKGLSLHRPETLTWTVRARLQKVSQILKELVGGD